MQHIRLVVVGLTLISSPLYPYYFGLDQVPLKAKDLVGFIDTAVEMSTSNPSYAEQLAQFKSDHAAAVSSTYRNSYFIGYCKGLAKGCLRGARGVITHPVFAIPTALGIGYVVAKAVTAKLKKPVAKKTL